MHIYYKNKRLERVLIGVNVLAAAAVVASFVCLFGFVQPLLPVSILYVVQVVLLCIFIVEKIIRAFNATSKAEFWRANWFEIAFAAALGVAVYWRLSGEDWRLGLEALKWPIGIYLILQVVIKVCRTVVNLAASGKNPTQTLIASFLALIIIGAGVLCLPRSSAELVNRETTYDRGSHRVGSLRHTNDESLLRPGSLASPQGERKTISFVDALFTATSAVCVTGLIVKDTGGDFSLMGQLIILLLIQLGGLGIVVFGVVFALLLGQALSLRESVAMQDLLSARTLGRISSMIAFIFFGTLFVEAVGAVSIFGMWDSVPGRVENIQQQWFYSIFHSVSAFCNAGFSLFSDSFGSYNRRPEIYVVICPLIILGGLGFGVLYDLVNIAADRVKRFFKRWFNKRYRFSMEAPRRMQLQTKIVLSVSVSLIVLGMLAILLFERYAGASDSVQNPGVLDALFQSIAARTTGFNTVDISALSVSSKFILILLMFIGGSPGSTAGGIKTVTLAVVMMTAFAALTKREEVEMFKRSVRIVVVGRAITVMLLFVVVLFGAALALSITEAANGFGMSDIMFETASALGTVGLSTGITRSLTTIGKLIIIAVMLIGRLGPLTLLAALTFNLKPARYNYPAEAIIVG